MTSPEEITDDERAVVSAMWEIVHDVHPCRWSVAERERVEDAIRTYGDKRAAEAKEQLERLADELDELRLGTSPEFLKAMARIVEALESTNIDWSKIRKIDALDADGLRAAFAAEEQPA